MLGGPSAPLGVGWELLTQLHPSGTWVGLEGPGRPHTRVAPHCPTIWPLTYQVIFSFRKHNFFKGGRLLRAREEAAWYLLIEHENWKASLPAYSTGKGKNEVGQDSRGRQADPTSWWGGASCVQQRGKK